MYEKTKFSNKVFTSYIYIYDRIKLLSYKTFFFLISFFLAANVFGACPTVISANTTFTQFLGANCSGGSSNNTFNITGGNHTHPSGGLVSIFIAAGESASGNVSNNNFTINNSKFTGDIMMFFMSAYNRGSSINKDNIFLIENSTFDFGRIGVFIASSTFDPFASPGSTTANNSNNKIDIKGSTFSDTLGTGDGYGIIGAAGDGINKYNSVNITGSTFSANTDIYGAQNPSDGSSSYNKVSIFNTTFENVAKIYGAYVNDISSGTSHNSVTIEKSTFEITTEIYGSNNSNNANTPFEGGSTSYNTISISDTKFKWATFIIGGDVNSDSSASKIYNSTNNTINIGKNVTFEKKDVLIAGGYDIGSGGGDITKGNTLNLESKISVGEIANFESLNFILPDNFKISDGDVMITLKNVNLNGINLDLSYLKEIELDLGDSIFKIGQEIVLIKNLTEDGTGGYGEITIDTTNTKIVSFDGWKFKLTLKDDNILLAEVITLGSTFNRRKSFSESQLASFSLILQGADELADTSSFAALKPDANGVVLFGNASGGKSRYETGSYVDLTGGNVHAGFGYKNEYVVFGAFGEFGTGTYKSHNEATDADIKVDAEGDLSYYGGGIVARIDFNKNIFFDTTFHIGQTTNTFSSNNIDRKNEKLTEFDTTSLYYGYSAGLGYKIAIGEQARIELFSKYLADTRQKIKEVKPTTDGVETDSDATEFDALNSMRVKAGGRYIYNFKSGFNMSFGGDYTIELDGEQKGRTINNEREIEAPTLKGGTASGKVGIGYNSDRFVLDLYGSGYFGVRTGYDGGVKFAYMFGGERAPAPPPEPVKPAPVLNESFAGNGGTFKANSSQLTTPTKTRILALSEKIKGLRNQDYVILVMGHTDNKGNKIKNKKLSLARAKSFKDELVKNGIDEKRVMAVGNGDEAPIATNKTAAGREQNRRVEIEVTNKNEWKNMNWEEIDNELADEKRRKEVENQSSETKNKIKTDKKIVKKSKTTKKK